MSHDHRTPQRKRPDVFGMTAAAKQIYNYTPRDHYYDAPMSLAEALARWLCEIGWVIDPPIPLPIAEQLIAELAAYELDPINSPYPEVPSMVAQNVQEPGILAEFNKNVTWGLTFGELAPEHGSQLTVVSFISDGGTYQGRARGGTGFQNATAQVLIDSVRPKIAMDVAMRVWDLFRLKPGFTVKEGQRSPYTGKQKLVRRSAISVRQALPQSAPTFVHVGAREERSQVVFRLEVKYLRH